MNDNPFVEGLVLSLKPSRYLAILISGLHIVVALVALLTPAFPIWARLFMAGVIALSAWRSLRLQYWKKDPRAIIEIIWDADEQWRIRTSSGETLDVSLASSSFVSRKACVLNFQHHEQGRFNTIILPDSLPSEMMQQFRMRWFSYSKRQ